MHIIQAFDEKVMFFFQGIRVDLLTDFFKIFIKFEFWNVAVGVLVIYSFIRTRKFRVPVISYFLAWSGAIYAFSLLKDYFHRPRPFITIKGLVPAVPLPHGYSFPSGHATLAAAMAVVLMYHFPKARYVIFALALLACFSRVYFGVHYLTDVLAGFMVGAIVGFVSLVCEKIILEINQDSK
jgi:undecaprenyl-diphosphatase